MKWWERNKKVDKPTLTNDSVVVLADKVSIVPEVILLNEIKSVESDVRFCANVYSPQISVILPTYNESGNVRELLRQLHTTLTQAGYTFEFIFVDDSKDQTPEVITSEAQLYPGIVTLVKRSGLNAKTGLTMAFRRGFEEARGEMIVCMDTDLQHPPQVIPKLLGALSDRRVDVSIASRYAHGGSAQGLDGIFRKIVSRTSSLLVWMLIPSTRSTTDPMTGFFAFRRSLLQKIKFSSVGFKILVELLSGLRQPRVIDIPFVFQKRQEEVSKAVLKQGFIFYRDTLQLFMTGTRGSVFVRFAVLVFIASSVFGILSLTSSITPIQTEDQNSLALVGASGTNGGGLSHLMLFAVTFLLSIPIFSWAFNRFNYFYWSKENFLAWFIFNAGVISLYFYFTGSLDNTVSVVYRGYALFLSYILSFVLFKPLWQKDFSSLMKPEKWFGPLALVFFAVVMHNFVDFTVWWQTALFSLYFLVILQGLFALFLMIYAWEDKNNTRQPIKEGDFLSPLHSFSAIVPCRHEKNTIADTLRAMHRLNYPEEMKQILVVIHVDTDDGTIGVVEDTIKEIGATNIQLVTYNETPVNKPHGLNHALAQATKDFVVIFDAEDEVNPDLFKLINTAIITSKADVVQSGVQLMDFDSSWYSLFNVLEYYFWWKSSMHFYAKNEVVPLGGNSVFFRRTLLNQVGGWDLTCLTEDAEIGIRLSRVGAKMAIYYDAKYATQEETPPTTNSFIKQRTRWAQGFLQILARGSFLNFPTLKQKLMALYILSWPIIIPIVFLLLPFGLILMLTVSLPPPLAVLSNVSLLLFLAFLVTSLLGFLEFIRDYNLKYSWKHIFILFVMFYPYTFLLTIASVRALYRNLAQITVWEKTEHLNTHRQAATDQPTLESAILVEIK